MRHLAFACLAAITVAPANSARAQHVDTAATKSWLLAADRALAAAVAERGVAALVEALASDAAVLIPGQPMLRGASAEGPLIARYGAPSRLSFRPLAAVASADPTFGCTVGVSTFTSAADTAHGERGGNYLACWRRSPAGVARLVGLQRGDGAPGTAPAPADFDGGTMPRSATPRSATPRSATPRSATPRSATPRAATPRAATPRAATPRAATPRAAPPRSAPPRSATPPSDARALAEAQDADAAFAAAGGTSAGPGEAFAAWVAADGLFPGERSGQRGAALMRAAFGASPNGVMLLWSPMRDMGDAAGGLAFTVGDAERKNAETGAVLSRSKYFTVWRLDDDGRWRWIFDLGSARP